MIFEWLAKTLLQLELVPKKPPLYHDNVLVCPIQKEEGQKAERPTWWVFKEWIIEIPTALITDSLSSIFNRG